MNGDRDALLDLLGAAEREVRDASASSIYELGGAVDRVRRHLNRTQSGQAAETTYAFDLRDPVAEEHHSIYRCDVCRALIESVHATDHELWHKSVPVAYVGTEGP